MMEAISDQAGMPVPPARHPQHPAQDAAPAAHAPCPDCAARAQPAPQQFVYALGRIEARFPTLGLEREYRQRERALGDAPDDRLARLCAVLQKNPHLAAQACYVFAIGGSPAYILAPAGNYLRGELFEALAAGESQDAYAVAVGRLGPMAPPQACGGVLAPVVLVDQLYTFRLADWQAVLARSVAKALEERGIPEDRFGETAAALFRRIVQSTENVGATDVHRALNYLLMQHPGIFLVAAEKHERHLLDRIETRLVQGVSGRKQVAVILGFVERSTGIPERWFTRVDVTEEWPFVSDAEGGSGPLGLLPWLENSMLGMPL
jgi:hypothetical protein